MDGCTSVKFPPKPHNRRGGGHPGSGTAPPQQADGGIRAIFGRNYSLVYPPTGWQPLPTDSKAPDCCLRREYTYGYNSSCKNSLHFISETECIYPVAALVVIQDLADPGQQRVFEGHNRTVQCVDWNEQRGICASGQTDPKGRGGPYICIWAPQYANRTICQLHQHVRQVSSVALSPNGQICVSFGCDEGHTMCIWTDFAGWDGVSGPKLDRLGFPVPHDIKAPIHCMSSGRVPIREIRVAPFVAERGPEQNKSISFYATCLPDAGSILTAGSFSLWSVTLVPKEEPAVSSNKCVFGKAPVPKLMTCIVHSETPGKAYMVADNGYFYALSGSTVTHSKRLVPPRNWASLGCVATLAGGRWVAGASDGTLYIGGCNPVPVVEETIRGIDLIGPEGELFCSTAQMSLANMEVQGDRLLLGTSNHALFFADLGRPGTGHCMQVSHTEEAWALDFHPSLAILVTASNGKDVRFWNVAERRPAIGKVLLIDNPVRALKFNAEGTLLALGCANGFMEVHGFPSLQPVYKQLLSQGRESFVDVTFSPDGMMLAGANWDQSIYLMKVMTFVSGDTPAKVMMHKVLTGNSSSPICIMFSADGEYLMSNSKDTQILFWKTKDGSRNSAISAYRDMPWQQPWTCVLGWPVIGLWCDPEYDLTDVNTVCQSSQPNAGYIALGDDYGKIKLFRFPSPLLDPPCRTYAGHGSHVTRMKFSRTNVLASLGGDDHSISQWSLDFSAKSAQKEPEPLVHPWVQFQEAEGGPQDAFGFLGKPRAASVPRAPSGGYPAMFAESMEPNVGAPASRRRSDTSGQPPSHGIPRRDPNQRPPPGDPNRRPSSGGSGRGGPAAPGSRRPASASGVRRPSAAEGRRTSAPVSGNPGSGVVGPPPLPSAALVRAKAHAAAQRLAPDAGALGAALPPRQPPAAQGYVRNSSNSVRDAMRED